jgi:hypothetical protein
MTERTRSSDDEPSNGIGDVLRAARRGMGVSLERAAAQTHLRETYLAALERDDVEGLGLDPAYVRGTLRTYADYLGLDSASLLARHHASVALVAGSRTPSDAAATDDRPRPHRTLRIVAGVVGLIVIAVLAFVVGETLARRSLLPFWEASDHGLVAWSAADESASRILVPRNTRRTGFAGQEASRILVPRNTRRTGFAGQEICDADDGCTVVE